MVTKWSKLAGVGIFLTWICTLTVAAGKMYPLDGKWTFVCPQIYLAVFTGFAPKGNQTAGTYTKQEDIHSLDSCLVACCNSETCNVVFMHNAECFHIECVSNQMCAPLFRPEPQFGSHVRMVLVQPVSSDTWSDIDVFQNDIDMEAAETRYAEPIERNCEVGIILDCPVNEECLPVGKHSRNGMCQCIEGFRRNESGLCEQYGKPKINNTAVVNDLEQVATSVSVHPTKVYSEGLSGVDDKTVSPSVEVSSSKPLKQLVVSVISKEVRLPENEVTLSAYTVPAEQTGEHYKYEWTLLSQPEGDSSGTMNDQNGGTLKLSHLTEGLYRFKVSVSSPTAYGETFANVSVLPPKRINQPPAAIITPPSQTVKLPNTGAVLDGSMSKDDDQIIGWHWELQQGPIGYQPHLVDTPTLQLDNLVLPGNYTFKLTVEDSDHAMNSTTANITVLKVTDYPPEANAGQDIIIYLPHNNLTLNGNLSTDDRGIASWEWTKSPTDQNKAVDMQNTRTPYLQLSNLEEGMYTFVLKVTDNSGQSSSAEVHVFVKPPTNKPPTANAGSDQVVSLPQTWVTLDGTQSNDDIKIVSWSWEQIRGPSKALFSSQNSSCTNATELTKGEYEFQLTVTDENGNKALDSVQVTVTQNKNASPKANGGGDQTVILPVSVVIVNGSQSSDDLGIVKWLWTREDSSLALGKILGDSDKHPVLMLIDVVPGRYVFRLKVEDEQGASDEDTVSIIVKADPHMLHLVELTLNVEGRRLTVAQQVALERKLSLLLHQEAVIHVRELREEDHTGRAVITFYVEEHGAAVEGPSVVQRLRTRLRQDAGLLELSVADIRTAVCQNNCSGHGVCDQTTRQCLCEAFWMQNLISRYIGDGEANCDWSILYVVIVLFVAMLLIVGGGWALSCLFQKVCVRRPRKRQKYSLLGSDGEGDAMIPRAPHGKVMLSESDSDSDVLFESRKCKMNGDLRNGHGKIRNGFIKGGHRVKT
ncbi:dyslexia-associated protein KIAA0319-like protein isoform X1 [Schistocerca gregaria]|uniref:dyslexia-associated protein KIAA0319-like protein isoform X1 n=1 Tax=Schistocerca gregaria TaxID=7010 RepID=UPI00211DAA05|nr:dyslexia-associated protein KIAA0319-like protein isoform X1 [Schistocerca gregaria]